MVLKTLQLQGFKSFADKTVIDFHSGVTGIVGPNGCGKSNIVDAIKWVLGETSAKALRGGEMADVIFNGTDRRQPHGLAEVTLTFSDCEKALGIDYNEVSITRRVYRDGKGEYALNGTQCRLRDINSLFMDTGVGQSAYSIMEQGKIDQLLSSKPEDRRAVFEEAAGITKFKTQKREAIRKLDYTDANLLRVTDIIAELKRQITSMQRQAAKARRYQEIHRDARILDTHFAHYRFTEWDAEKSNLTTSISSLNGEIERLSTELSSHEEEVDVLRRDLERTDGMLSVIRSQVNEHHTRLNAAEGRIGFNGERVRELESLIEKSQEEIEGTRLRLAEQEQDIQVADDTLIQITAKIAEQEASMADHASRTHRHRDGRESVERELRELRRMAHQAETAIISQQARLTNSQSQIDSDQRRHDQLLAEMSKLSEDRLERADEEARIVSEHAAIGEQRAAHENECAEMQDRLRQTQIELDLVHKRQREIHKILAEKQSRLDVLEQLMDRGEGPTGLDLGHGLRKLNSTIALVMLTSYADPLWMGQRREAPTGMRYVVKGDVSDPAVLGDAVAAALVDPLAHVPSPSGETPLSEGQWEILRLVASGYTNAEIAKRRSLTVDSVNKAITRLVRQLDIQVGDDGNARVLLSQAYRRMTGTVSDRRG